MCFARLHRSDIVTSTLYHLDRQVPLGQISSAEIRLKCERKQVLACRHFIHELSTQEAARCDCPIGRLGARRNRLSVLLASAILEVEHAEARDTLIARRGVLHRHIDHNEDIASLGRYELIAMTYLDAIDRDGKGAIDHIGHANFRRWGIGLCGCCCRLYSLRDLL